jgi:hypothetical protein
VHLDACRPLAFYVFHGIMERLALNRFLPPAISIVNSSVLSMSCLTKDTCSLWTLPPIPYCWTGLQILDHSHLVGNLTD